MPISPDRFATKTLKHTVGIETVAGAFTPLIDAGTPLPAKFTDTFSTAQNAQSSVRVALASQAPDRESSPLGSLEIGATGATSGKRPRIRITVTVDDHGWVEARVKNLGTGQEEKFTSAEGLPTGVLEETGDWDRHVDEAGDHVAATMNRRVSGRTRLAVLGGIAVVVVLGIYFLV